MEVVVASNYDLKDEEIKNLLSEIKSKKFYKKKSFDEFKLIKSIKDEKKFDLSKIDKKERKAIACFVGSAIGDAAGVHTEFSYLDYDSYKFHNFDELKKHFGEKRCEIGEFSDDTSMALCVADSIFLNKEFDPVDLRKRFLLWWHYGYNNCRNGKSSFGLGANINQSFYEFINSDFKSKYFNNPFEETNGNGSLMRNAPIPIMFAKSKDSEEMQKNIIKCMEYAKNQSRTTHNGREAYECCMVLSNLIIRNINNQDEISRQVLTQELTQEQIRKQIQKLTQDLIDIHLVEISSEENFKNKYCYSVNKLIKSEIEDQEIVKKYLDENKYIKKFSKDNSDRDWNWKNKDFKYSPTRANMMPDYIGSYCMDALSMALHIIYYSTSSKEAIFKAVNMNGDADTVACIVGQIAGSIWGLDDDLIDLYKIVSKFDQSKCAIMAHLLYNKNN